ncbi:hypothetical protein J2X46_000399 [Nocardioides sp. BE266]|uniref:DUF1707 SHOCT-like domain-containing protein n=1 Tax=Nocardioides sp. BE266 TaxID=2817725 RepID=UPI0028582C72|nr:DUF1707 domain-containing protein [Nocardioides sp. BE266]MDR7251427.1 hypothetical protein [Nocardioides sp. BE266]
MRGFRAKDADRDRAVEVIEAAYADGQIGDADRELRVGRALSAETLDELQGLTRDLQVPAGLAMPPAVRTTLDAGPPRQRHSVGLVAGLGAFVVLIGVGITAVVAVVALSAGGESDSATSGGVGPAPFEAAEATPVEAATTPFTMTAPQVRRFLKAYEKKFGMLDAWEVGFYPDRVGVQVPVSRTHKRFERWSWTGTWRQDTEASAVIGPQRFVSLGYLDVGRMFDNIARAKRTLDVPGGKLTHVLVNDWGDGPSVNIYIGNQYNETGYLKTEPGGAIVRAYPYDG